MKTATWVKIHGYISVFFLPLALIYTLTGLSVIAGHYGNLQKQQYKINVPDDRLKDLDYQQKVVTDYLSGIKETLPTGKPRLARGSFYWGVPAGINVSIAKGDVDGEATLHLRKPDWIFSLVMLHKAKGGQVFDYLGFAFGIAMIIMYVSGIFIFWKIKAKRKALLLTLCGGMLVTIIAIYVSL